jgi:hypothetical protein
MSNSYNRLARHHSYVFFLSHDHRTRGIGFKNIRIWNSFSLSTILPIGTPHKHKDLSIIDHTIHPHLTIDLTIHPSAIKARPHHIHNFAL